MMERVRAERRVAAARVYCHLKYIIIIAVITNRVYCVRVEKMFERNENIL